MVFKSLSDNGLILVFKSLIKQFWKHSRFKSCLPNRLPVLDGGTLFLSHVPSLLLFPLPTVAFPSFFIRWLLNRRFTDSILFSRTFLNILYVSLALKLAVDIVLISWQMWRRTWACFLLPDDRCNWVFGSCSMDICLMNWINFPASHCLERVVQLWL